MDKSKTLELLVDEIMVQRFSVAADNICGIPAEKGWWHHLGMRESGKEPQPMMVQIEGERATLAVPTCVLRHIYEAMRMELDGPVEFRAAAHAFRDQARRPKKIEDVIIRLSQENSGPKQIEARLNLLNL